MGKRGIVGCGLVMALVAATLGGCASETADTAGGESDFTDEAALTPENFVNHPRIVEVRKAVAEIDALRLASERKDDLCPGGGEGFREKHADATGKVRKVAYNAGGEHGVSTTTLYFASDGKLRFAFEVVRGWLGENDWHVQKRVYFNRAGERFFEVHRKVTWQTGVLEQPDGSITPSTTPEPDIDAAPYTAPAADEAFFLDETWEKDPGGAYASPAECY